ncbi:histidine phosphatase family protein [Polycladidibacter hongkongensis]|uniref:histidine phosphatase family protein n=1 Tax=Polycladidibacter hongkongensis TaxID=1647556 RepID=UPI00082C3614|nr:histidine phosphatase family protein [Pseudovibrio hongkongensis]
MGKCYYLTHPQVDIDPARPVTEWSLSDTGRNQIESGLTQNWLIEVDHIFASKERKSFETAQIIGSHLGIDPVVIPDLHEIERSATGFLEQDVFEAVDKEFFSRPAVSVEGWERALDAQRRVVNAIQKLIEMYPVQDTLFFAGHGGVGTLLRCHLGDVAIDRAHGQIAGGGQWFSFAKQSFAQPTLDNMPKWQGFGANQSQAV